MLTPKQVRYRICRELRDECDEANWPIIAGFIAARIAEEYEEDYLRCEEVSQMVMAAEKSKVDTTRPSPVQSPLWRLWHRWFTKE